MIDIRKEVVALIREGSEIDIYFTHIPKDASLPCIVYNEVDNRDYIVVKNNEYANIAYNFTIYTVDPVEGFDLVKYVDEKMRSVGFKKDFTSQDQIIDGVYVKTIRFKAIVNQFKQLYNNS